MPDEVIPLWKEQQPEADLKSPKTAEGLSRPIPATRSKAERPVPRPALL